MDNFSDSKQYDFNDFYKDPYFNPIAQYEQGYMYYKFLTQQLEYKIKCKELENLSKKQGA